MSPKDLLNSNFEIVVTLEGSIESTGSTTQVPQYAYCIVCLVCTVCQMFCTKHTKCLKSVSPQARSSYLPNEVLWGFRFDNLVSYAKQQEVYAIDCSAINRVLPDNTPRMSAYRIQEIKKNKKVTRQSIFNFLIDFLSRPQQLRQLPATVTGLTTCHQQALTVSMERQGGLAIRALRQ